MLFISSSKLAKQISLITRLSHVSLCIKCLEQMLNEHQSRLLWFQVGKRKWGIRAHAVKIMFECTLNYMSNILIFHLQGSFSLIIEAWHSQSADQPVGKWIHGH